MADLEFIIHSIRSEIKVDASGVGRSSIIGASRLAGVDDESIRKSLITASDLSPSKMAQNLMVVGFTPSDLNSWRTEGIPDVALGEILAYYAYDAGRYCTEEAKLACKAFRSIGIRVWMQQVTGWEKPTTRSDEKWRSLPPSTLAAMTAKSVKTIQSALGDVDPRLAQILIDVSMRTIDHIGTPSLPPSTEPEYAGVVEIAQELGFKVDKQESKLGRFVAKAFRDAGLGDPLTAKRECGGAMRSLKVYPKNEPIVISAIKEFFA